MKSKMKLAVAIFAMSFLVGCDSLARPSEPPQTYPISSLDGKPMYPNSWHKAHVRYSGDEGDTADFILDDGTYVHMFFGGGSAPWTLPSASGTLYVEVPSFEDNRDEDNLYNFEKFVPDVPARTATQDSKKSLMTTGDQSPAVTGSGNNVTYGSQQ